MPDRNHLFATRIVEFEKFSYQTPLVVGGFVGPGLVGLIAASYLIEQLGLHQVAHVSSQHIPPVAVFVGGKLRHPFRIYRRNDGKVIVIICEVPIGTEGLYEVSSSLLTWLEDIHPRELVVLDGVPVEGIPEDRKTYCVAGVKRVEELKSYGLQVAQSALISGVGGSILSECLSRRVGGISLLTQASVNLPDPGAVLALMQTLNTVYSLNIGTEVLQENVEQLNKDLNAVAAQYSKILEESQGKGKPSTMYA